MVFKVIKPWLGDELLSRVHLFGGTSELKQFVDSDQLLTDFGGNVKDSFQKWAEERAKIEGVSLDKPETHQFANEEIVAAFSDAPVTQTADGCIYQGWLKKQGGFVKKFNKRYCVVKGTILYYYRTQKDPKADGVVFLRNAKLAADKSTTFHIITSAGKDCIFQLNDKKQTEWIKVLETVIVNNGGSVGKSGGAENIADPVDQFGITWQPQVQTKQNNSELFIDELFQLFSDESIRAFPEGHIPGSEIVTTLVNRTGKSRKEAIKIAQCWLENQFLFPLSSKTKKFSDSEDEVFLFTFCSETSVLNFTRIASVRPERQPTEILEALHTQLVGIIKSKLLPNGGVDCATIRKSREFFDFLIATSELQLISLDAVKDTATFFYNVRSLLFLHAQIQHGIGTDCVTRLKLFSVSQYCVGMNRFSIADISHGILRANTGAPESLLSKHFSDKKDPRLKFCLKTSDERVVFALFPGITLDPFHFSKQLSDTLNEATTKFVNDFVEVKNGSVYVSVILTWVNVQDRLSFVSQFMSNEEKEAMKAKPVVLESINWGKLGLGCLTQE